MRHVTLNTGHTRESPRSEVGAEAIRALRPLVHEGGGEVPGFPGYRLTITREKRLALYTVVRISTPRAPWPHPETPIITCGLAQDESDSPRLWKLLRALHHEVWRRHAVSHRPRSIPWLGIVILPGLTLLRSKDVAWLGDFERCLAWTLVEEPLQ